MKEGKISRKRWLCFAAVFLLVLLWSWRYCTLNQYYQSLCKESRETYQLGDTVSIGENYLNKDAFYDGYKIQVNDYSVVDFDTYLSNNGISTDVVSAYPEKLALVSITLSSERDDSPAFFLPDIWLHSVDNYAGMDWELLAEINPALGGNYSIQLSSGESCELVLPFDFYKIYFGEDTWKHVEECEFFLHISAYPIEKDICVIV